jgi:hypothetical protein
MDGLMNFLARRNGRITRAVIGVIVLIIGLAIGFQTKSLVGWILVTYSIFLLLETGLDLVLLAPFFGKPMSGAGIRGEVAIDDPLSEFRKLNPELDEKSIALLNVMRFWLFGTFVIVSAAVYTYGYMLTYDNDFLDAFKNTSPIIGGTAVLCFVTYVGYWWYITRIKSKRSAAPPPESQS